MQNHFSQLQLHHYRTKEGIANSTINYRGHQDVAGNYQLSIIIVMSQNN